MERRKCLEILGLPPSASEDEIKKAYKNLARQYHPDKNDDEEAKEKFQEISGAYTYLTDPEARRQADMEAGHPSFMDNDLFMFMFFQNIMRRQQNPFFNPYNPFFDFADDDDDDIYFDEDSSEEDYVYTRPTYTYGPDLSEEMRKKERRQAKKKRQKERQKEKRRIEREEKERKQQQQQKEQEERRQQQEKRWQQQEQQQKQQQKQQQAQQQQAQQQQKQQNPSKPFSDGIRVYASATPDHSTGSTKQTNSAKPETKPPEKPQLSAKQQKKKLQAEQNKREREMKEMGEELKKQVERDRLKMEKKKEAEKAKESKLPEATFDWLCDDIRPRSSPQRETTPMNRELGTQSQSMTSKDTKDGDDDDTEDVEEEGNVSGRASQMSSRSTSRTRKSRPEKKAPKSSKAKKGNKEGTQHPTGGNVHNPSGFTSFNKFELLEDGVEHIMAAAYGPNSNSSSDDLSEAKGGGFNWAKEVEDSLDNLIDIDSYIQKAPQISDTYKPSSGNVSSPKLHQQLRQQQYHQQQPQQQYQQPQQPQPQKHQKYNKHNNNNNTYPQANPNFSYQQHYRPRNGSPLYQGQGYNGPPLRDNSNRYHQRPPYGHHGNGFRPDRSYSPDQENMAEYGMMYNQPNRGRGYNAQPNPSGFKRGSHNPNPKPFTRGRGRGQNGYKNFGMDKNFYGENNRGGYGGNGRKSSVGKPSWQTEGNKNLNGMVIKDDLDSLSDDGTNKPSDFSTIFVQTQQFENARKKSKFGGHSDKTESLDSLDDCVSSEMGDWESNVSQSRGRGVDVGLSNIDLNIPEGISVGRIEGYYK